MTALHEPILHPDHLSSGILLPAGRKRGASFARARNSGFEHHHTLARPFIPQLGHHVLQDIAELPHHVPVLSRSTVADARNRAGKVMAIVRKARGKLRNV